MSNSRKYAAEAFGTFWLVLGGCGSAVLAASQLLPYILAQVIGAIAAGGVLFLIASGKADFNVAAGFAPIAIGLCLTLIHLISIPVTNTSVNPARSTGVAVFVGDWATSQLWLFWLAPIVGAVIGATIYKFIAKED